MADLSEKLYNLKIESGKNDYYLLEEMLACLEVFPTTWVDADRDYVCQNLYFITADEAEVEQSKISSYLSENQSIWGLENLPQITVEPIDREDWSEVWKKYFHTKKISERLVIRPSWEKYTPKEGEVVLDIDPGMSFGTGQHGTTQACLKFLDELTIDGKIKTMLDAGTGSGILSIGARKLGVGDIDAFDYDPDAVRIALENLTINGIEDVKVVQSDLADWSTDKQYDVVVANILCVVLLKNAEILYKVVNPGQPLLLAGILEEQYNELRERFEGLGMKEIKNVQIKEWKSGVFVK